MPATQIPIAHSSATPDSNPSTLFFGFLVSVLSIFAAFITSTVVLDRLVVRRHAIDPVLALATPPDSPQLRRPEMWNIWVMPDKQPHPWLDIKPVAAQKCDCSSGTMQTEQTTSSQTPHLPNRLPPRITHLLYPPPSSSDAHVSQVELSHGSDIQVSLLVIMPHALQSTREGMHKNHPLSHEVAFATADVLYHDPASS